jgi:hypothetical protein
MSSTTGNATAAAVDSSLTVKAAGTDQSAAASSSTANASSTAARLSISNSGPINGIRTGM